MAPPQDSNKAKKPGGGRPLPRRLFSIDSLRKEKSGSESDSPSLSEQQQNAKSSSVPPATISEDVSEKPLEDPFADSETWTEKSRTSSPGVQEVNLDNEPTPRPKIRAPKPVPLNLRHSKAMLTGADAPIPSPGKRRWDTIRAHVLPSSRSPAPISPAPSGPASPPFVPPPRPGSAQSGGSSRPQSPRPQTPKGYRFGQRKMFRQVVEQAREVAEDEVHRFEEELRRACWAVRYSDASARPKIEREASQGTVGSSLYLPFLASTSTLPMASSSSLTTLQSTQKTGMKRPPSMQSMATIANSAQMPSLTYLSRILTQTTTVSRPRTLPLEAQVLSTLLVPFLELKGAHSSSERFGQEQETSVETFEFIVKTWKAASNEVELERCLWCCRVASVPSGWRTRILGSLSALLFSRERNLVVETPLMLRTILNALLSLLVVLRSDETTNAEGDLVQEFVGAIIDGQCGTPSAPSLEKEYGVRLSKSDSDMFVRQVIVTESAVICLEQGSEQRRRWALRHLIQTFWPVPEQSLKFTSLMSCMHARKLRTFIRASISLLTSSDHSSARVDAGVLFQLLQTRILGEAYALRGLDPEMTREEIIRLALELLRIGLLHEQEDLAQLFSEWYKNGEWTTSIDKTLSEIITYGEWPAILRILPALPRATPETVRLRLLSSVLPLLNDRLMATSPELPCLPLSSFLDSTARLHPKLFFKPLFTCAASAKDLTIANQIGLFTVIVKYLPDFWFRDPEMMAVALMSDPSAAKSKPRETSLPWSKVRTGQLVLLLEVTERLRWARKSNDMAIIAMATKFAVPLEARIGLLLEAKEQTALVPIPQRILFCVLFREFRLLTRSLKQAAWLPQAISWTLHERSLGPSEDDEDDDEPSHSFDRLRALYIQAQEASRVTNKRRTTVFVAPSNDDGNPDGQDSYSVKLASLKELNQPLVHSALPLLVCVSGLLKSHDYMKLGPFLWEHCLDDPSGAAIAPATFLLMQSAEKCEDKFFEAISKEMSSGDEKTRLLAVQRMSTAASWRFQVLTQEVILDRNYRRPFKVTRPQAIFVPTDMGTGLFVLEEDPEEFKDGSGNVLPLELRRRLSEIGWDQEARTLDPKTKWIRTPLSLLPSQQLDTLDTEDGDSSPSYDQPSGSPSPEASPSSSPADRSLVRRGSSSGGRSGVKRRPVFVAAMASLFPQVVAMTTDPDFAVADAARHLVLDLMHDDPTLLARATFQALSGDETSMISATTTARTFLHVSHMLPPALSHHVLNHLAGFLKLSERQPTLANPLQSCAYVVPSVAKLVTQVSKMSMREVRRAKVDTFLVPSGSLWFTESSPPGPMFPRALGPVQNPFESVPPPLIWITMIRTAQNMLFLSMLKRDPGDMKIIRKSITRLILPSLTGHEDQCSLPLSAFVPSQHGSRSPSSNPTLTALSLTLARSYLMLVSRMFKSMSRHSSDRQELAVLADGLNRILIAHGDDVGIVGHTMLAFLTASTRFKRVFISGGGYALFMPAVFKTYCEAESHPGIRAAIEYVVNRFFALHQESFVFQSVDVISHLFKSSGGDNAWMAGHVFRLFSTLKGGVSASTHELAGIADIGRVQEQEAFLVSIVEEVPQRFFASLRKTSTDKAQLAMDLPQQPEHKYLRLDDFIRLFLTVIAHNPIIQRAERFLRLLQLLAPYLYHGSGSARNILREGIDALGLIILTKGSGKNKSEKGDSRTGDDFTYAFLAETQDAQQPLSVGDQLAMRFDYLSLVVAFTKSGGQLSPHTPARVVELVKLMLKDSQSSNARIGTFLEEYTRGVLLREPPPRLKEVVMFLNDLSPVLAAYSLTVDFSGVFDVIHILMGNPVLAGEPVFARAVVSQYCGVGLEACELAASENLLFSLPSRSSLMRLLRRAVPLPGADVIGEVERRNPSCDFLAGVVLPFVLTLGTSEDMASDSKGHFTDPRRRHMYADAWLRLLAYVLSVVKTAGEPSKPSNVDRRKSQDSRSSVSSTKPARTLAMAVLLLKVIIMRGCDDITATMPGIWFQVATTMRLLLDEGDATFALRPRNVDLSEPPSPTFSPVHNQPSPSFTEQQESAFLMPTSPSFAVRKAPPQPRLIDYLTWSFVQWLCLRRSPLVLQMQGFVQEKVAVLHQLLSDRQTTEGRSPFISPSPSRPVSMFTKPRRSIADLTPSSSVASTPRNSMFLNTSISLPVFDDASLRMSTPQRDDTPEARQAGYARQPSPMSPTLARRNARMSGGPKIVHLGPVSPGFVMDSGGRRSISPSGRPTRGDALGAAKDVIVESPLLVRMTYHRIRTAQAARGYRLLLPVPGSDSDEPPSVATWTRAEAIEAVVQEVKDLLEEFNGPPEIENVGDESGVFVTFEDHGLTDV